MVNMPGAESDGLACGRGELFGLPGVIAAPIYYAYLKLELKQRKLI